MSALLPSFARFCAVLLMVASVACADEATPPNERDPGGPPDDDEPDDDADDDAPMGKLDAGPSRGDAAIDARVGNNRDATAPARSDARVEPGPSRADGGADAAADAAVVIGADASSPMSMDASSGPNLPPFETNGEPLSAPDRRWTYVDFPDTKCRDGSPAGLGLSLNPASKKVMIYLEGGGACWDSGTCLINPANADIMKGEKTTGVFNRANMQNPVRDWNFVYVPYCTGDTHGGANPNATVPGVLGTQQFVGYLNMEKFLQRVVPTFRDAEDVILTGISAGGFGTAQTAVLVQRAFGNVKVKVIDDSGPPLSKAIVPECLQKKWRETWKLDQTFLKDCGSNCPNKDDFTQDFALYLARTFGDRPSGLISADQDGIISGFFGAGRNNCTGAALLTPVPGPEFKADLLAYREKVKVYPTFGTFFIPSTNHTWIGGDAFYTTSAGGVKLVDWFAKIVNGENAGHTGP